MKEAYDGMYIELGFCQNRSLRPKDEVQSAHFPGKQFTLHCSIVYPVGYRYHFHLSDDTTHDPVFVDQTLRKLIRKYDIKNQDLWIQSDNAPTQYKNKYVLFLLQRLTKEFNLRIIRTFGVAGHRKGTIDEMSSFGVKNILKKDIVTNNIFFNKSKEVVHYFSRKCLQFNYEHIPSEDVVKSRIMQKDFIIIRNCMKQHLMVFTPTDDIFLKEYLCSSSSCLQFHFKECTKESLPNDVSFTDDVESYDESDDDDDGINRTEQFC